MSDASVAGIDKHLQEKAKREVKEAIKRIASLIDIKAKQECAELGLREGYASVLGAFAYERLSGSNGYSRRAIGPSPEAVEVRAGYRAEMEKTRHDALGKALIDSIEEFTESIEDLRESAGL